MQLCPFEKVVETLVFQFDTPATTSHLPEDRLALKPAPLVPDRFVIPGVRHDDLPPRSIALMPAC